MGIIFVSIIRGIVSIIFVSIVWWLAHWATIAHVGVTIAAPHIPDDLQSARMSAGGRARWCMFLVNSGNVSKRFQHAVSKKVSKHRIVDIFFLYPATE